jgi:hypothetical protein
MNKFYVGITVGILLSLGYVSVAARLGADTEMQNTADIFFAGQDEGLSLGREECTPASSGATE